MALKYLERLWGSIELIKFIVVSVGASNIIAFGFNWIEFAATQNSGLFLYAAPPQSIPYILTFDQIWHGVSWPDVVTNSYYGSIYPTYSGAPSSDIGRH